CHMVLDTHDCSFKLFHRKRLYDVIIHDPATPRATVPHSTRQFILRDYKYERNLSGARQGDQLSTDGIIIDLGNRSFSLQDDDKWQASSNELSKFLQRTWNYCNAIFPVF